VRVTLSHSPNIYFQCDKFINTVNRNLVDSNMFIRSLILSLEHFRCGDEAMKLETNKGKNIPSILFIHMLKST